MKPIVSGHMYIALGILLYLFLPSKLFAQTNANDLFGLVPNSQIPSGYLADQTIWFEDPFLFDGSANTDILRDRNQFETFYYGFSNSYRSGTSLPSYDDFTEDCYSANSIYLAALLVDYQIFNPDTTTLTGLSVVNDQISLQSGNWPIVSKTHFSFYLSESEVYSLSSDFYIDADFLAANGSATVDSIEYRIGGSAPWSKLSFGQNAISWGDTGTHCFNLRVHLSDGRKLIGRQNMHVASSTSGASPLTHLMDEEVWIQSKVGDQLEVALQISYGCGHHQLVKPLIIVEGFNPEELSSHGPRSLQYKNLIQNMEVLYKKHSIDLLSEIPDNNYDLIYVDLISSSESILENAEALKEAIRWINEQKWNGGSTEGNVIIGASMGGLVTNVALRQMELDGENHDCSIYVSFDSPHLGANVPLSIQYLLYDLNTNACVTQQPIGAGNAFASKGKDAIASTSALQMTTYNVFSNPNGGILNATAAAFYTYMDGLGLPQQTWKNIALSNGNLSGHKQGFSAGSRIMLIRSARGIRCFKAALFAPYCSGSSTVYNRVITVFGNAIVLCFQKYTVNSVECYDHNSGGGQDMNAFTQSTSGATSTIDQSNFVPVMSSLRLKGKMSDPDFSTNAPDITPSGSNLTDFDSVYFYHQSHYPRPIKNELHVELSPTNYKLFDEWLFPTYPLPSPQDMLGMKFNIGRDYRKFTQKVINDYFTLEFSSSDSSVLHINKDDVIGDLGTNGLGSNDKGLIQVEVGSCPLGQIGFEVGLGGKLVLGGGTERPANLLLTKGILWVRDGGVLRVNPGSKIVIDEGALLRIDAGAKVDFRPGSILHIRGRVEFNFEVELELVGVRVIYDAPWSSNHEARWDYNATNTLTIQGTGINDTILEVWRAPFGFRKTFGKLTIKNGTIKMAEATHISHGAPIELRNVKMTTLDGLRHDGIRLWGQPNVHIFDLEIEHATTGIKANLTAQGHPLFIQAPNFHDCDIGLSTRGKSVDIEGGSISNNNIAAWVATDMENPSKLNGVDFKDNSNGIDFSGQTGSSLHIEDCLIKDNEQIGIAVYESDLSMRCSVVKDNGYGVYISHGRLFIGENASNRFEGNYIGIYTDPALEIRMDYGSNRFLNNTDYHLYAEVVSGAPGIVSTQSGPELPANQTEFTYVGSGAIQQLPVHIFYESSNTSIDAGGTFGPQVLNCGSNTAEGPYEEIHKELSLLSGSQTISTAHISNKTLPQVVSSTIDLMVHEEEGGDVLEAIHIFYEAYTFPLTEPNTADLLAKEYAYKLIFEAYGLAIRYGEIEGGGGQYSATSDTYVMKVDSLIDVAINELDENDAHYAEELFRFQLDEGLIMRLGEYYEEAEDVFKDILIWNGEENRQKAEYWECVCAAEHQLLNGEIAPEEFESELLFDCRLLLPPMKGLNRPPLGLYQSVDDPYLSMDLSPNPGSDRFIIDGFNGRGMLLVYDSNGNLLDQYNFEDARRFLVEASDWNEGMYLLKLSHEGKTYYGKWIKI